MSGIRNKLLLILLLSSCSDVESMCYNIDGHYATNLTLVTRYGLDQVESTLESPSRRVLIYSTGCSVGFDDVAMEAHQNGVEVNFDFRKYRQLGGTLDVTMTGGCSLEGPCNFALKKFYEDDNGVLRDHKEADYHFKDFVLITKSGPAATGEFTMGDFLNED